MPAAESLGCSKGTRELKQRRRKRHLKITLFYLCDFVIISTRSTFIETETYLGNRLVGVAFKLGNRMNNSVLCSRSPQNLEFGHFTLLFCRGRHSRPQSHAQKGRAWSRECRGRQRNVPKFTVKRMCRVIVFLI